MREPLPLAIIHDAVLEFLRHRDDAVLFGAQAVNAYVDEPRMTQDVDILSMRAAELDEELRKHLADKFHIAARIREAAGGMGFRIYQLRQPKNRHLVDVRQVAEYPPFQLVAELRVLTPEQLIAQKLMSYTSRHAQPKGDSDRRDLKVLLLAYPHLKSENGPVMDRLKASRADDKAMDEWKKLVASDIRPESEEY